VASEVGATAADDPQALVESGVEALVIATTTSGHAPLLHLAASAGLPAFCEKPVALDLATVDLHEDFRAGDVVDQLVAKSWMCRSRKIPPDSAMYASAGGAGSCVAARTSSSVPSVSVTDTVRERGESACPLEEARAALAVALAADRSRAERRPVSVEEVDLAQTPSSH
jgi:predicted dehydrogenase